MQCGGVEGERVQRRQVSQALVELRCKAGNTQQTVTIADAIRVAGGLRSYQQDDQNAESAGNKEGLEDAPEGQAQRRRRYRRRGFPPYNTRAETLWAWTTVFQPSCARSDGGS